MNLVLIYIKQLLKEFEIGINYSEKAYFIIEKKQENMIEL